jgi:hypothetical protein
VSSPTNRLLSHGWRQVEAARVAVAELRGAREELKRKLERVGTVPPKRPQLRVIRGGADEKAGA